MKEALVRLSWTKSASNDVVDQLVNLTINSVKEDEVSLDPTVESYEFWAPEKSDVVASIIVSDGANYSEPVSITFKIGDLTAPLPVTGLVYEIVDVREAV